MPGGKRKRLWNAECTPFPDETPLRLKKTNIRTSVSAASISNAWLRCGDGFQSTSVLESQRPSNKKSRSKKCLGPLLTSAESASRAAAESAKEAQDIIWTSSGSDFSDDENKALIPRLHSKKSDASKTEESPSRHDLLLEDRSSEDELKLIDWEKDTDSTDQCDGSEKEDSLLEISDSDSCTNTNSLPVKEENDELCKAISTEIAEYSSDNDSAGEGETSLATAAPGSSEGLQPSKYPMEWKGVEKSVTSPVNVKMKLLNNWGGLAERLCRLLQNRERSAISFWRHQCISDDKIPSDKSGVLIVKILEIFEECTIQVAICQQLEQSPATLSPEDAVISAEEPILKVLFTKETAAHLKGRPQDVIHIYPPWPMVEETVEMCRQALKKFMFKKQSGFVDLGSILL
ncbi:hypothetical protein DUI87_07627 [Hirundo rustica rustica]|uniref:DUF4502 domain-containing protein n=1 Tax=Hirundo rustica rustica TaxID=333673 RepID=A0A3M0KQS1_HIRRU|nr:hypothetical protein DUI87_07627 [Hirundo rustica rustica]